MQHRNTLLHDLLIPMPWSALDRLVGQHRSDKRVRTLSTKDQLIALLHAQLSGATSLREIETTMASHRSRLYHLGVTAPKRSTLADANRERPADVFVALFQVLLAQAHKPLRRETRDAVRLIDSTSVSLSNLCNGWASYEAHGAGVKMHVVYDPDAQTPVHFTVTAQRCSDISAAKAMPIEAGATYVFDLGYYDFGWWARLAGNNGRFVTRLKINTPTRTVETRAIPPDVAARGRVTADRIVRLPSRLKGCRSHPLACDLREVHVTIDTGKKLRIVSNDLISPAEVIADLYKTRWQIELFFRWVKQTLKIKKFLGTSENAVRIQVAVALIAYLLLRIALAKQKNIESPLAFARLVRSNLMHFKTIHDFALADPPRTVAATDQLRLNLH
jgi:Transposase DDE domain/Domain of unknown function (DUF4372)